MKLFSTKNKADFKKNLRYVFFSKNGLFGTTYVVSSVVEKYFFLLSFSIVALLNLNKLFEF